MSILQVLSDKTLKGVARRQAVMAEIMADDNALAEIEANLSQLDEKRMATILEAIEEITNKRLKALGAGYLRLAVPFVATTSNSCRREASRIVGNLAADFPAEVAPAIDSLLANAVNGGTVVRWSAAYALSRIVVLPASAASPLRQRVEVLCEAEQDNGVRGQYERALKKLRKPTKKTGPTELGRVNNC